MNASAWYENKLLSGALAVLILAMALVLIGVMFFGGGGPECPPGQVWSDAHGHCH